MVWKVAALGGFVLASAGNVGWALAIGDFGVAWTFWAFAVGALVAGASLLASPGVGRWLWASGWTIGAAGALRLGMDELGGTLGRDFPAPELYYLGFIAAAVGAVVALVRQERWTGWVTLGGIVGAALGGLWWTVLDLQGGSFDYTWANACLGVGFALVAAGRCQSR